MVRLSIFAVVVCGVASVLPLRAAHAAHAASPTDQRASQKPRPLDRCVAVGACTFCDPLTEAHATYCAATRRRQKFACSSGTADADEDAWGDGQDAYEVDAFNGGPGDVSSGVRSDAAARRKDRRRKDRQGRQNPDEASSSLLGGLLGDREGGLGDLRHVSGGGSSGGGGGLGGHGARSSGPEVRYFSCASTSDDDIRTVAWFEAWMAALLLVALWGVRAQKGQHMTLYERRKRSGSGPTGSSSGSSSSAARSRSQSPIGGLSRDSGGGVRDSPDSGSSSLGTPSKGGGSLGAYSPVAGLLDFAGLGKEGRSPTPSRAQQAVPLGGSPAVGSLGKDRLSQRGRSVERSPDFEPSV